MLIRQLRKNKYFYKRPIFVEVPEEKHLAFKPYLVRTGVIMAHIILTIAPRE